MNKIIKIILDIFWTQDKTLNSLISKTGEYENKMMWKLSVIYCISCGENLGIRLTQSELQDYFYCRKCYRIKLDSGFDLEEQYNRLGIHNMVSKTGESGRKE